MSPVRKRWLPILVLLMPVVVVLIMELLLQLGSLVMRTGARDMPHDWLTSHTRIIAVGDSNTFGLYLEPAAAYPAQLEARWNARFPEHPIEVLNLGYPGMNSFRVLDNIDAMMAKFQPNVVLLTVGVNDMLTPIEEIETRDGFGFAWLAEGLARHSRLYHLVHMVRESRTDPRAVEIRQRDVPWNDDVTGRFGDTMKFKLANQGEDGEEVMSAGGETFVVVKQGEAANNLQFLAPNLAKIEAIVAGYGADLYLLTYGSSRSFYGKSNFVTRNFADQHSVELIDVAQAIRPHCPETGACPAFFFEDLHPNAAGYAIIADAVAERLARNWSLAN